MEKFWTGGLFVMNSNGKMAKFWKGGKKLTVNGKMAKFFTKEDFNFIGLRLCF